MTATIKEQTKLEQIISPCATEQTKRMYASLASEAKTRDFGLMEQDVVVLDTETTGLSFKQSELIEIAAYKLHGREVVEKFQTYVHPTKPIPDEIQTLTGIHQRDVVDAPSAQEAIDKLAAFVSGLPVIAHNASFDRTFIEHGPGAQKISDVWIDTLVLSRIALPCLTTHKLADLAQAFDCAGVSHEAEDDVAALCGVWRILLCALTYAPQGLLSLFAHMHEEVTWAYRPIFSYLAQLEPTNPFSMHALRKAVVSDVDLSPKDDPEEKYALAGVASEEITQAFAQDGLVSHMYEAYEPREEQLVMAQEVTHALNTSSCLTCEAGTGVGKSIAYLLPLVKYAQKNNITVGVATKTNALTDQLISHELPALQDALDTSLRFSSLKGYEHYPCLRQLEYYASHELPLPFEQSATTKNHAHVDMLNALAISYMYVAQTVDGDLDALGIKWKNVPVELVSTSSEECSRSRCPYYPDMCPVQLARAQACASDVVVTNHSLLLSSIATPGHVLPPICHWVIDEAHSFEQEARRSWSRQISAQHVRTLFEKLGNTRMGALHTFMGLVSDSEDASFLSALLVKISSLSEHTQLLSAGFFDAMHELIHLCEKKGSYTQTQLWVSQQVRTTELFACFAREADDFLQALCDLEKKVSAFVVQCASSLPNAPQDFQDIAAQLRRIIETLQLMLDGTDTSYVYSFLLSHSPQQRAQETLLLEKIDIGQELAQEWLPDMYSVIFTSATMAIGQDFSHFNAAVGLSCAPDISHTSVQLNSSYDFDAHMAVVVPKDLPDPRAQNYIEKLADMLVDIHKAMDGSVLTLFTNRYEMEKTFSLVAPELSACGLDLIQQEKHAGAYFLRNKFIEDTKLSLFALKSFWEGFDAAGETLRCVVIPKLPFASPQDPLVQERAARDPQAWRKYCLPEAVISVKQAAGRLIRSSSDEGLLVLADSRVVTKGYGKAFLSSMPTKTQSILHCDTLATYIGAWRFQHD